MARHTKLNARKYLINCLTVFSSIIESRISQSWQGLIMQRYANDTYQYDPALSVLNVHIQRFTVCRYHADAGSRSNRVATTKETNPFKSYSWSYRMINCMKFIYNIVLKSIIKNLLAWILYTSKWAAVHRLSSSVNRIHETFT